MKPVIRFIVVDDDPINNVICRAIIHKAFKDTDIQLFEKPETALEAIENEYGKTKSKIPTILFLDINMPDMTGWMFLDAFKNFNNKIRKQFTIYMVSSSIDKRDVRRAELNRLVSKYISKPMTAEFIRQITISGEINKGNEFRIEL